MGEFNRRVEKVVFVIRLVGGTGADCGARGEPRHPLRGLGVPAELPPGVQLDALAGEDRGGPADQPQPPRRVPPVANVHACRHLPGVCAAKRHQGPRPDDTQIG
eukprot:420823-Prorocentrum_minimum.AAC.5